MVKSEVIDPQGQRHLLLGINRTEFEGAINAGTIVIELSEYLGKYKNLFIIGGETDDSIEAEIKRKMNQIPKG